MNGNSSMHLFPYLSLSPLLSPPPVSLCPGAGEAGSDDICHHTGSGGKSLHSGRDGHHVAGQHPPQDLSKHTDRGKANCSLPNNVAYTEISIHKHLRIFNGMNEGKSIGDLGLHCKF